MQLPLSSLLQQALTSTTIIATSSQQQHLALALVAGARRLLPPLLAQACPSAHAFSSCAAAWHPSSCSWSSTDSTQAAQQEPLRHPRQAGSALSQLAQRALSSQHDRSSRPFSSSSSNSSAADTTTSSSSSSSGRPPKNLKGSLPSSGPSQRTLRALPFAVSRDAAQAAFKKYHGQHWYQSRQTPVLAKPFKESLLPFWVGAGSVLVRVSGAEVGVDRLVTRRDRSGRAEPRWETVWSKVQVDLAWERVVQPQEAVAQLYASWKYPRSDVEVLRPAAAISLARPITPDMLQASAGAGTATRRVGPFTVEPAAARLLLMARIEAEERQRAEKEIARLASAQQARFVDMHATWIGSTGSGGLDLSPVYVPAYVFSWWHGGAKVRTFVSGVDAAAVSGVQVLDDTKLATLATLTTAGAGLLLGLSAPALLWGGLVVPFVAVGVISRFWPLLRSTMFSWRDRLQQRWKERGADQAEPDWDAAYVHAFEAAEGRRRQQDARQSHQQSRGPFAGGAQDPREFFEQFMRDPFSWFEKFAQQQQQSRQGQWQGQRQQQHQSRQQRSQGGGSGRAGSNTASGPPGDPRGFYAALGLQRGCSTQEVQAAFRGLALQHHPDRAAAQDKERATKQFQVITEAYQVLRDEKKRAQYDAGQWTDRA